VRHTGNRQSLISPLKNACRDVILSLALAHSLQEGNLAAAAGTGVHAVGVSRAAGVAGGATLHDSTTKN